MSEKRFCLGIDFGTESGRTVLVDVQTGHEVASSVYQYANGVIDEVLPGTNIRLELDTALQDPSDYINVLKTTIPEVLKKSGTSPESVIGIGIDFTACTMLPTKADGTPLCFFSEYRSNPHAWVKLWKHHAAQPEATRLNSFALRKGYSFLNRYGGKISSEWFVPKVWQILNEAPEIYQAADRLIEAADWIVWQLTGMETRNSCTAGYKALWSKSEGFPEPSFFSELDPRLANLVDEKLSRFIQPVGQKAGGLSQIAAGWTGLLPGTAVAIANVDAHVAVPASTVVEPGRMVIIMGTSNCHMVLSENEQMVPGICGVVEDGIIPGFFGYEAGQSCVGDHFAWFVENCVPPLYWDESRQRKVGIHALLEEKAACLEPGESGLLALDWWNGNRSVLVDAELSGLFIGMTLATRPEEIYRALIEATAFGTRMIIDTFTHHQVTVNEIVATGGLPDKNRLLMQIYADVTGMPVRISASSQAPALGSAMFAAVAAGQDVGGYQSILEASRHMAHLREEVYLPDPRAHQIYNRLFEEYHQLHDLFGRGGNDVMKRLRSYRHR